METITSDGRPVQGGAAQPVYDVTARTGTPGNPTSVQGVVGGVAVPVAVLPSLASVNATIANGASLSGAVDIGAARRLLSITMPAAWTAAGITLQISNDGTNYADVYDAYGTEYAMTVAASRCVLIPADLRRVRYLKIRSGTSGTPVNQAAERVIAINVE